MALLVVMASWGWSGGGEWLTLEEVRRRQWEVYWRSVEEGGGAGGGGGEEEVAGGVRV